VHGANRLASNSLLETVVFAHRAVQRLVSPPDPAPEPLAPHPGARVLAANGRDRERPTMAAVRELMWRNVGIVRTGDGLAHAAARLHAWAQGAPAPTDLEGYELRSILTCARLATEAASLREESRGAHYRADHPEPVESWRRHIVFRREV